MEAHKRHVLDCSDFFLLLKNNLIEIISKSWTNFKITLNISTRNMRALDLKID